MLFLNVGFCVFIFVCFKHIVSEFACIFRRFCMFFFSPMYVYFRRMWYCQYIHFFHLSRRCLKLHFLKYVSSFISFSIFVYWKEHMRFFYFFWFILGITVLFQARLYLKYSLDRSIWLFSYFVLINIWSESVSPSPPQHTSTTAIISSVYQHISVSIWFFRWHR